MKRLYNTLLLCLLCMAAWAADKPVITTYNYQGMYLYSMSDNGQWGLIFGSEECTTPPMIVNLKTKQVVSLQTEADVVANGICTVNDVTDDGNIVVGSYKGHPAYLNRATGRWTEIVAKPGALLAVTPDGKYAVGSTNDGGGNENSYEMGWYTEEYPLMCDLTTNAEVSVAGIAPDLDPKGNKSPYNRLMAVSPDGRYVLGRQLVGAEYYSFLLDRTKSDYTACTYIGYKTPDNGFTYQPAVPDLYFAEPRAMSPNGKWVCCDAYIVESDGAFNNEYGAVMRYNIETGAIDCYRKTTDDQSMLAGCIDNEGHVYAATPQGSPVREMYIRSGDYWHALRSVLTQCYGMDYATATGYDNTGTPLAVSADGNTIVSMVDPQFGQNFCLQMNESLIDVCDGLNLLGYYTMTPAVGSVFSRLSQIKVTFDREVEVVGAQTAATFGEWASLSGNGLYVDPTDAKTVIVAFRIHSLENGKTYTFKIPAGTIAVKGDRKRTNDDIAVTFTGRADVAMTPVSVYPADGSALNKIDNASSPVLITFPVDVAVTDNATAGLYTEQGQKVCALTVAYNGNSVALYPANTQYLYLGTDYKVVLDAGAITDVAGGGANEAYTVHYAGSYEREVSTDDMVIFKDDFNNMSSSLATWMMYEGDHGMPNAEISEAFEFDADNTPWNVSLRDTQESTDYYAASHSIYEPVVQAEDWMVTPQLYIPDASCVLSFDAQNYGGDDRLKVIAWVNDDVLSRLTDETAEQMLTQGTVIFDEQLTCDGDTEAPSTHWKHYTIDLSAFAGKSIYLCFGNQNYQQSMVFIDNVLVQRNMQFLLTLTNKQSVVAETSAMIAGKVVANAEGKTFSSITVTLRDGSGNKIDEQSQSGLTLTKGDSYAFSFSKPLPLTIGEVNRFTLDVKLDDAVTTVTSTIKDLAFEPTKRVVLEEFTGYTCGNCPLGIIAIEKMEQAFGSAIIPIGIHGYDGDAWGTGMGAYYGYLNLQAAPSGIVNRNGKISFPMEDSEETFEKTYTNGSTLWYDVVAAELDMPTDLDVSAKLGYAAGADEFTIHATVRSAINTANQNLNVFMVLMEDGLVGVQTNYYAGESDAVLGEWGVGGSKGQQKVPGVIYNDVARMCYGYSMAGTGGLLPQTMNAGQEYTAYLAGTIPGTVENKANCKVAVVLIDANTDRIVNACVVKFRDADTAVKGVEPAASGAVKTYNLQGVEVDATYRGIVVRGGKKFIQ